MKTLQELYNEIIANDGLKNAFVEAVNDDKAVEFAREHGVETTLDEIKAFLEASKPQEGELAPEEMENAAGGACNDETKEETLWSQVTLGFYCLGYAIYSATTGRVGQKYDDEGRLCNGGQ